MFSRRQTHLWLLLVCAADCLSFKPLLPEKPRYAIVDLGKDMIPTAINKYGTVVGNQGYFGEPIFLWRKGKLQLIQPPEGFGSIEAYGLNDKDWIVGETSGRTHGQKAFLYREGKFTLLPLPLDISLSANNRALVVGVGRNEKAEPIAYLWEKEALVDLNSKLRKGQEYAFIRATIINDQGQVAGKLFYKGNSYAALYDRGELINLGVLPGYTLSEAWGLNNQGQVVGDCFNPVKFKGDPTLNPGRGFLYSRATGMVELKPVAGEVSSASGINDQGQVVGAYATDAKNADEETILHAVLWQDRKPIDLNQCIKAKSGWVLNDAKGINFRGQIIGTGTFQNERHGFVLIPQ